MARAKQLLQDAGVDPTKLTLTLDSPMSRYPMDKEFTEATGSWRLKEKIRQRQDPGSIS